MSTVAVMFFIVVVLESCSSHSALEVIESQVWTNLCACNN